MKCFRGHNFGARTLRFLHFEVYLASDKFFLFLFFIQKFCASSVDFFRFLSKFSKNIFFKFFLKRIRCSKYKQQGFVKVLISYTKCKIAMLVLQNCDLWSVFNKHQNFEFLKKKTRKLCIMQKKITRIKTFFFHVLHLSSKFLSFSFDNKKILKLNRSP